MDTTSLTSFVEGILGSNPLYASSLTIMALGSVLALLATLYHYAYDYTYKFFVVSVSVDSSQQCYEWLEDWIEKQTFCKDTRSLNALTDWDPESDDIVSKLKLVPDMGDHYFIFEGRYIWMHKSKEAQSAVNTHNGAEATKTILLRCFAGTTEPLRRILEAAREDRLDKVSKSVDVFTCDQSYWCSLFSKTKRPLASIILEEQMKSSMISDISQFLSSKDWYSSRGLPYRRGYLLYGPPGCGKSSALFAIAGHFNLNICCLSLNAPEMNDGTLTRLMQSLPSRAAVLLEDVDCVFVDRKAGTEDKPKVSFSALLNVIDGVNASEGRIIFMTTNHKEKLSKALIRPGRIDRTYLFGLASRTQLAQMFELFFPGKNEEAEEFSQKIPDQTVSCAAVQGHLLNHREDARESIERIQELLDMIKEEQIRKSEENSVEKSAKNVEEMSTKNSEERSEEKSEGKIKENSEKVVDKNAVETENPSGAAAVSA